MLYKSLKLISFISFILFSWRCGIEKNVYNESDYNLVKTDLYDGIVYKKNYIYKYDGAREMKIEYWDNGKILAKSFLYRKRLDGELVMYDMEGKISAIDSFRNGEKVYSKRFTKSDTSVKIFKDGKLLPFESIDSLK